MVGVFGAEMTVLMILYVVCVALAVRNELLKLFISPCELILVLFL